VKYAPNGGDVWYHAPVLDSTGVPGYDLFISSDDLGIMIWDNDPHLGTFGPQAFTIKLGSMLGSYQDFKVFATEMVYVRTGAFYAGDGASPGRFYEGSVNNPWYINSENAINRGTGSGQFDQEGSISTQSLSADFPKGYDAFWAMKYKITARQYIDFLNCLTRPQQENRVQADITGTDVLNRYVMTNTSTATGRNPIRCDEIIGNGPITFYADLNDANPPNSADDGQDIVLAYLSIGDIYAYLDWSGLRPMTELEYEKICRGEDMHVVPGELAWGTSTFNAAGALTNAGTNSETTANVGILSSLFDAQPLRAGYAATSTSSRTEACATFYGVMDIHNKGEFMIGVNSTNFVRTSYGDGELSGAGNGQVSGWSVGVELLGNGSGTAPDPISAGKTLLLPTSRPSVMGARGVRRLQL
jgi:formylglycine-generating enzyme required for sulfatase activity